jgi:hypothetical protein
MAILLAVAPVAGPATSARAAPAQTLFSDGFHNATTSSPVVGLTNTTGLPCLTAGTSPSSAPIAGCGLDPVDGSGVLRLTRTDSEISAVVYQPGLALAQGLNAQFKVYMYGGGGADGISFDLAVAPPNPGQLGPDGGSLGYSTDQSSDAGLSGGWLGVGFDTYGNFAKPAEDGSGCIPPMGRVANTLYPNAVTVRGPGNAATGYCVISSTGFGSGTPLAFTMDGGESSTRSAAERGVQIVIDPTANTYTVGMDPTGGSSYSTVTSGPLPSSYFDQSGNPHPGLPATLTFLVAGSSGSLADFHEISDLTVATLTSPSAPSEGTPPPPIHHNDHAGSNDPNPNTNPTNSTTARIATSTNPTVSTSCSSACSLGAVTRDEQVTIDATDTAKQSSAVVPEFTAASVDPPGTPVFSLTIDGGRGKPDCLGYRPRDRDWVQFAFESGGSAFRKTGTMTPNRGMTRAQAQARLQRDQVCFSAPYRFTPRPGFRLRHAGAWFDGVLPECAALPARSPAVPCVTDRTIVRVGDGWGVRLEFWVPPGRQDPKALG